jgi:hypothetical protein
MGYGAAIYYIGMAIVAAGTVYSGIQQKKAADYNAKVLDNQAHATAQKAKYDEALHRERVRKILSRQRAVIGKSGVELAGSSLLALEDTAKQGEMDALAIRHGGSVQEARARSASQLEKIQGRTALTGSVIGATGSLLTGAAGAPRKKV